MKPLTLAAVLAASCLASAPSLAQTGVIANNTVTVSGTVLGSASPTSFRIAVPGRGVFTVAAANARFNAGAGASGNSFIVPGAKVTITGALTGHAITATAVSFVSASARMNGTANSSANSRLHRTTTRSRVNGTTKTIIVPPVKGGTPVAPGTVNPGTMRQWQNRGATNQLATRKSTTVIKK